MVYPQGNYIHESNEHPFLQIGEVKYGKPILDRVIKRDVFLERAARCAMVSMNSTVRSNVTGSTHRTACLPQGQPRRRRRLIHNEDAPFACNLAEKWNEGLFAGEGHIPHTCTRPATRPSMASPSNARSNSAAATPLPGSGRIRASPSPTLKKNGRRSTPRAGGSTPSSTASTCA